MWSDPSGFAGEKESDISSSENCTHFLVSQQDPNYDVLPSGVFSKTIGSGRTADLDLAPTGLVTTGSTSDHGKSRYNTPDGQMGVAEINSLEYSFENFNANSNSTIGNPGKGVVGGKPTGTGDNYRVNNLVIGYDAKSGENSNTSQSF